MKIVLLIALMLVLPGSLFAKDRKDNLTASELQKVQQICVQFLGTPVSKMKNDRMKLMPYVYSKASLEHTYVSCSAVCYEYLPLRGPFMVTLCFANIHNDHTYKDPPVEVVFIGTNATILFEAQRDENDSGIVLIAQSRKRFLASPPPPLKALPVTRLF